MASTLAQRLRGFALNSVELKSISMWPDELVEDYLSLIENLLEVAGYVDGQKIETIPTDFTDGSIPFASGGFLEEDNGGIRFDNTSKSLLVGERDAIRYGRRCC